MPDQLNLFKNGYKRALMDMAELLNNAESNTGPAAQHYGHEIMDQLAQLGDGVVTHDELMGAGK